MVVTGVSHSCLLIELGPICDSMAASLCFKSCDDHTYLKAIMEVYGKHRQVCALNPTNEHDYSVGQILKSSHVLYAKTITTSNMNKYIDTYCAFVITAQKPSDKD